MKRLLLELGGKGAAIVFDDADVATAVGDHRQRVDLPLRPDLHRADPGDRPHVGGRRAGRQARRHGQGAEGRRPARARHRGRAGHHRRPPRAGRGLRAVGARRGRHRGRRRRAARPRHRLLRRPDPAGRRHAGHEGRAGGDLRAGRSWCSPSTTTRRPSPSRTTRSSASTTTCSRRTRRRPWPSPSACARGNVGINTAQRNHEAAFGGFKYQRCRAATAGPGACTPTARCSRSSGPDDDSTDWDDDSTTRRGSR